MARKVASVFMAAMLAVGLVPATALGLESPTPTPTDEESLGELIADGAYVQDPEDVAHSGVTGNCTWTLDSNGVLVVRPIPETDGELPAYGWEFGWKSYYPDAVVFEGGVKVPDDVREFWFYNANSISYVDMRGLDTSTLTDLYAFFAGCSHLKRVDMSGMDLSNVTNLQAMFMLCTSLEEVDFSGADLSSAENFNLMFEMCGDLKRADFSGATTAALASTNSMFYRCGSLESVDMSDMGTASLENVASMFSGCSSLVDVDFSGWDTARVTNATVMLKGCSALEEIDLSPIDTTGAAYMDRMFDGCTALRTVTLGEGFSFTGDGSASCALPTPDPEFIPDATGKWVSTEGRLFAPADVPSRTADTYRAQTEPEKVQRPVAATGLEYDGTLRVGVPEGIGYTLSGEAKATRAGNYAATATLEEGYVWSDGSSDPAEVRWSIAKAPLTATYAGESIAWDGKPILAVEVTGFVGGETAETAVGYAAPVVVAPEALVPGRTYELAPQGGSADDYEFRYVAGDLVVGSVPAGPSDPAGPAVPSEPTYSVELEPCEHGELAASPMRAKEGATVTVTADPAAGFELSALAVTDSDGNNVEIEASDDGTAFLFEMPRGGATISALFECDGGPLCPTRGFPDVDQAEWYHSALDWAVRNGVLNGFSDTGLMRPDGALDRAQMAQILYNAAGRPDSDPAALAGFSDCDASAWYASAVSWAVAEGLFEGYGATGTFGPYDGLTREQAALVLMRWAEANGFDATGRANLSSFPDSEGVSEWAWDAVSWAIYAGILRGVEQQDGTYALDAQRTTTRAQMAALMMRLAENDLPSANE